MADPETPLTPQQEMEQAPTLFELMGVGKPEQETWPVKLIAYFFHVFGLSLHDLWASFQNKIATPIRGWLNILPSNLEVTEDRAWEGILEFLKANGMANPQLIQQMLRWRGLPFGVNSIFNLIMLSGWLKNYVGGVADVTMADLMQKLNAEFRPSLPQASTAIQAGLLDPHLQGRIQEILRRLGYKEEDINILYTSQKRGLDPTSVMLLYLRQEIDKPQCLQYLSEIGITEDRAEDLIKTWQIIPGPQDLLTMVAHEAFEPDMIERYGLGTEFPEEQSKWLEYQGLSRFWQERYWNAHWVHPGPGQIMDMLHRQVTKPDGKPFTMEDVFEYFRVVEIPPYWRNMLSDISFSPYTRVDTRRMHEMGVLTDEELIKAYMDQGYDQEHAGKMAEFTKRFNAKAKTDLTAGQVVKAYRNNLITRLDAKELLLSIKYSDDLAEWVLTNADFEENLQLQTMYVDALKTRYTNLLIDDLTARTSLAKLNLPGARIDALMERWSALKIVGQKLPSKTDLDKFFKTKIIDEDTYKIEMYKLGYDYRYTDWYIRQSGVIPKGA